MRKTFKWTLWGGVFALVIATGLMQTFSEQAKPDFARLYQMTATHAQSVPVVLIPGVFGSRLSDPDTGEELWPGSWYRLLFSSYEDLALDIDEQTGQTKPSRLVTTGIAESTLQKDFYRPVLHTLTTYGGYRRVEPGQAMLHAGERRLYVFAYDWRQDIVVNARALDKLIKAIRQDYGNEAQRVDIVAHSMGGLIARYYLRHGVEDVLDGSSSHVSMAGADKVNKLVLLGTPNFGSVSSLHAFISGEQIVWNRISPLTLASFPSGYQLFPHPLNTWLLDTEGKALPLDIFNPAVWQRFQWSVFDPQQANSPNARLQQAFFAHQLERARRLAWMLSVQEPRSPVHYILFGGGCHATPARLLLEQGHGQSHIRLNPSDVQNPRPGLDYQALMTEPGDGRVTKPSLLARETLDPSEPYHEDSYFPLAYSFFLCDEHRNLTSNVHFQDNLLHTLLSPPMDQEPRVPHSR